MTPSSYQDAIYGWVDTGRGSAIVDAVAGSGKTTTLLQVVQRIPRRESVRFFAFNKQIADTLKGRMPSYLRNVTCSTYHSGGFGALMKHFGARVEVDKRKWWTILDEYLSDAERKAYGLDFVKLLDAGRNQGIGLLTPDIPETWATLADQYDIEFDYLLPPAKKILDDADYERAIEEEKARVWEMAHDLLGHGNEKAKEPFNWAIDFTDQLYLPVLWDLPLPQYDWVLVDEAQDTNAIQRELIRRSLRAGGRLLAVGDPRQSIYAWRGASHNAMDLIEEEWECVRLPLSVCYRCGARIVEKAKTIVPEIEPAPEAEDGEVQGSADLALLTELTPEDVILCRNNAPLLEHAYNLIAQGVPVRVLGRDIGEGLRKLVRKLTPQDIDDLSQKLHTYEKEETERYKRRKEPEKAERLHDKVGCLYTIIDNLPGPGKTLEQLDQAIDGLFGDRDAKLLTLSTIHKAKGKEWRTVAIIKQWLIPSRYAKTPEAQQQEQNLLYVAWTRAQERLLIMKDKPDWLEKKEEREQEGRQEEWDSGNYFDNFVDGKGW